MLMMRHSDEQENEVRTFIKEIRRYAAIEELDEAVLNRLISKILVGEVKKKMCIRDSDCVGFGSGSSCYCYQCGI